MLNPSSTLRRVTRGGPRRRPSAAMTVALVALFVALSGGAYAAVRLPAHSVGATQLRTFAVTNPKLANNAIGTRKIMNSAVTFNKIKPGSVGTVRIDKNDVQLRLKSTCPTGQAISGVDVNGNVTCVVSTSTPGELNSANGAAVAVSSPTTAATISTLAMPGASAYMVQSAPYVTVTPSTNSAAVAQHVVVTCTLAAGPGITAVESRSVSFDLAANADHPQVEMASIPLTEVAASNANATSSTVSCVTSVTDVTGGNAGKAAVNPATVTAQGPIYATQVTPAS